MADPFDVLMPRLHFFLFCVVVEEGLVGPKKGTEAWALESLSKVNSLPMEYGLNINNVKINIFNKETWMNEKVKSGKCLILKKEILKAQYTANSTTDRMLSVHML